MAMACADVEPALRRRDLAHHPRARVVRLDAVAEHELHAGFAEPVVKIFVVKVETGERESRILEQVRARAAAFDREAAGFVLQQIGIAHVNDELPRVAHRASFAPWLVEALESRLELTRVLGATRPGV